MWVGGEPGGNDCVSAPHDKTGNRKTNLTCRVLKLDAARNRGINLSLLTDPSLFPAAALMNGARDEFLAGAGLAGDEHVDVSLRNAYTGDRGKLS